MQNLKKIIKAIILIVCATGVNAQQTKPNDPKILLVFFDGLRADYITPELMPNLYAFKKQGVLAKQHHSVFPTVTRLNASAYSTGAYPSKTGIMGNVVYFPELNKIKGLNTGDANNLKRIDSATNGSLLTSITFAEVLKKAGKRFTVFSSGSSGQAFLQNHKLSAGPIINPDMILPSSYKETVFKAVGPFNHERDHAAKHTWVTDALIKIGLQPDGPEASAIWISDPDHTTHADGIGTESAALAIKTVDAEFGRIINHLKSQKLDQVYNVIVSADHGFITHIGKKTITGFLIEKGLKLNKTSDDVIVADGAIYVKDHKPEVIKNIVIALQEQKFIGAIFTKGAKKGDMKGWVDGTISFEAIHWDHPTRAGDILVDEYWTDKKNKFGYEGTSYAGGPAGHGGFSPYEVHIALMASGPGFKKNIETNLPTSNIDIVPTALHLLKVPIPQEMDGRVVYEILKESSPANAPTKAKTENIVSSINTTWGSYKLTLQRTILGKYIYADFASTERIVKDIIADKKTADGNR
jgi:predicted AlkP superfamily pyrophosphatase or phosphodiesterase